MFFIHFLECLLGLFIVGGLLWYIAYLCAKGMSDEP